ncbi:NUDIX hydrolase [Arsenicicoccus cauae]|uniref:NUDIX hydrolase n=1 Tax=Arsenicicoccus cauae TaxID=2663847 RepID=UPI00370D5FB1
MGGEHGVEQGVVRDFPAGGLGSRARAWLDGDIEVRRHQEPRYAATVQLVRDPAVSWVADDETSCGVEVFMLRRVASMAFAPRMMVFPGGGVDPRDADPALVADHWAGPSPAAWAQRMACSEDVAQQLVVAAVREVFEECGVLLAGPDADSMVADVRDADWHADRVALEARELSFTELLRRRGLVLRSDLLSYRAHWVTPEFEPRRYDTAFFAALLPVGQVPDDATSEADAAGWWRPTDVLAGAADGSVLMLPPTIVALEQLAVASSSASFVAETPEVWSISSDLIEDEQGRIWMRARVPDTGAVS